MKNVFKLISICLVVYLITCKNVKEQFQEWKQQQKKKYVSEEEEKYRYKIFESNYVEILKYNADKSHTQTHALNEFADMTDAQFEKTLLNDQLQYQASQNLVQVSSDRQPPKKGYSNINWVQKGAVSPVRSQGSCGSCWAFAANSCLQNYHLIKSLKQQEQGKKVEAIDLSEQQLVDCAHQTKNNGCNGGWPHRAFQYILKHGITYEQQYPYKTKRQTCKVKGGEFIIKSIYRASGCTALARALKYQSLAVAVDSRDWRYYSSGIKKECGTKLTHAVLLVGVTNQYWLIKNSWGTKWGQNGYIRLALGNTCGICQVPGFFARD